MYMQCTAEGKPQAQRDALCTSHTTKAREASPKGAAEWQLLSTCSAPQKASRRRSVMRCARAIHISQSD